MDASRTDTAPSNHGGSGRTTMPTLVENWLAAQLSPLTRTSYEHIGREWLRWCESVDGGWEQAQRGDVDRYRQWLARPSRPGGKLSSVTIAKRLSVLASLYRFALEEPGSTIERSPLDRVRRPRVRAELRRTGLTLPQARALLAESVVAGQRQAALVHLLLMTAVRVSEACNATTADLFVVDGERGLKVVRKGDIPDEVLVPAACWEVLSRYLEERSQGPAGPLLMTQRGAMSRQEAYRIVSTLAAEVAPGQKVGPHSLRHTAATLALDDGRPLQEVQMMLGHSTPTMTSRYDQARAGRGRGAGRALGALLG